MKYFSIKLKNIIKNLDKMKNDHRKKITENNFNKVRKELYKKIIYI